MLTGPRGKIFLSYRWSGTTFRALVERVAYELVRRGYEVVFDGWFAELRTQASNHGPLVTLWRELSSCNFFLAVLSPDYLHVLTGRPPSMPQYGDVEDHAVQNDGWVRDELDFAVMNLAHDVGPSAGLGLRVGEFGVPKDLFPFPTLDLPKRTADWPWLLDPLFGWPEDIPEVVQPEFKQDRVWHHLPSIGLPLAYASLRIGIAAANGDEIPRIFLPASRPYWSRIDRRHVIYERRALLDATPETPPEQQVWSCPTCTMQFEFAPLAHDRRTCPRCLRGQLITKLRAEVEALAVLSPTDGNVRRARVPRDDMSA